MVSSHPFSRIPKAIVKARYRTKKMDKSKERILRLSLCVLNEQAIAAQFEMLI
jgi:hypothetical protein